MTIKRLDPLIGFAHRGLHDAESGIIENSPSAIAAAVMAGVGIEIDVQMSLDRVPMVFHDEILSRLAGIDGRLAFMTARAIEAVSYTNSNDRIISLARCLELIDGAVPLLIEVKSHWHDKPQMEENLARTLDGYKGPYGIMSFDPDVMTRLKAYKLSGALGLVTQRVPVKDWQGLDESERQSGAVQFQRAADLEVDFIAHQVGDLHNRQLRDLMSARNLQLFTWTVRSAAHIEASRHAGAQPIFEGEASSLLHVGGPGSTEGASG